MASKTIKAPRDVGMTYKEAQDLYNKELKEEHKKYGTKNLEKSIISFYADFNFSGPVNEGTPVTSKLMYTLRKKEGGKHYNYDLAFPKKMEANCQFNSIDEASCEVLTALVALIQPQVCLETGTHKGRSTRAIAEGLSRSGKGTLFTVDRTNHKIKESGALEPYHLPYVTPIIGSSPEVLEEKLGAIQGIEFAFLDSVHSGEGVLRELEWLEDHRAEECIVVVDNARDDGWPGIQEMFRSYKAHNHINIPSITGFEIIQMKGKNNGKCN